jgi:hypothetical protein
LGGTVFELDYIPKAMNYSASIKLTGKRLETLPNFRDAIYSIDTAEEDIIKGSAKNSRLFYNEFYVLKEMDGPHLKLTLRSENNSEAPFGNIQITKAFVLKKEEFVIKYNIKNCGSRAESFIFTPELHLSFLHWTQDALRLFASGSAERIACKHPGPDGTFTALRNVTTLSLQDIKNELIINLGITEPAPLLLSCDVERGLYQSTGIYPVYKTALESGGECAYNICCKFMV